MCPQPTESTTDHTSQQATDEPAPPPKLNPEDYLHQLDEVDLTDAQKIELLQTLWHIMATMVDIGFGVDSVQSVLPALFEQEKGTDHAP